LPSNFQSIVDLINSGLRVCVIMRGVPGSGKSWLANKIVDCTVRKSHRNYIFSTDDFFMDPDGNYVSFLDFFCGSLF
jgi:pantothenate kinase-related protein Tda10